MIAIICFGFKQATQGNVEASTFFCASIMARDANATENFYVVEKPPQYVELLARYIYIHSLGIFLCLVLGV